MPDDQPVGERQRADRGRLVLAGLAGGLLTACLALLLVAAFLRPAGLPPPTPAATVPPPTPSATVMPSPTATPTPRITAQTVLRDLQPLSRLETSTASVQAVVTVERPGTVLGIGRQRLLVIVQGRVVAGIDLGKLRPEDVTVSPDGRHVHLRLPPAEIFSRYLDETKTQVYDHQTGLLTRPDSSLVLEAQRVGAEQVLATACEEGILTEATMLGQRALAQLLTLAGIERVTFAETVAPSCPPPTAPSPPAP